jgi:hypothetical protein
MRKAIIPAFLLLLGSMVLGATVLREPIARAAAPITNVFVTNDSSHPVPVHEQGTANVNVGNTVQVNPGVVSTKATDNPAFQAFKTKGLFAEGTDTGLLYTPTYTVPVGKELVVESVSYSFTMPASESPTEVFIASGGAANPTYLPPTWRGTNVAGEAVFTGYEDTRIYFEPGDQVYCSATRQGTAGFAEIFCDFNGYLVSLP